MADTYKQGMAGCLAAVWLFWPRPAAGAPAPQPQADTATAASGAGAVVHGRIFDLGSPDPLPDARVEALGTSRAALGDVRGFYRLDLESGECRLRFGAPGHAFKVKILRLSPGDDTELNVSLEQIDFAAGAYVVRGKKEKNQTLATTLSRAEIEKIPGTAGDALRGIQNLPGIAVSGDLSSQLAVQGGGPNDNLYLLDNIPWPFPFHFGGILSTVNSSLLSSVDLNAAGFGARWGNCLGAVLDAQTRAGKKDRLHASLEMNLVTSQLLVEGPLGAGDASFALAGRRSYFDLFMGSLLNRYANGGFTVLPYFWDLEGVLDFSLDPANHVRALALGSNDRLGLEITADQVRDPSLAGEFSLENGAVMGGASWINTALPGVTSTLTPYGFQTRVAESLGTGFDVDDRTFARGLKAEAEWKAGGLWGMKHNFGFGGNLEVVEYGTTAYSYTTSTNGVPTDPASTTVSAQNFNCGAYLQDRIQFHPDWVFTGGIHYDKNSSIAGDQSTPRLGLEWRYDSQTLWKAAWGVYDQFPGGLETDPHFGNPQLSANLAEHGVLSLEKKFSRELTGRIDAYYKRYDELAVYDSSRKTYVNEGEGTAKGVEVLLREDAGERFFGWISYAYSKSERLRPPTNQWAAYPYDQPNILTLVASWRLTPVWSAGVKAHYNTGLLAKSLVKRYQDDQGIWRAVFSDTYDRRLDDYFRLDARMDYSWRWEGWRLNLYLEILNLLNRLNPAGVGYSKDYSESHVISNLPRMPYFGLEAEF